jgi:ArsR family transcriptional regulator, arsenate/arsenite/antimonite-responsive transcriptional repressor
MRTKTSLKPYPLERLFQALADRTRLRLLHMMAEQEVCVCYFVQVLEAPQPKISRHLAYLRRAGLVMARREGKWMHYRLAVPTDPWAASVLKAAIESLQQDKIMRQDLALLQKACCGPKSLLQLIGAPVPTAAGVTT